MLGVPTGGASVQGPEARLLQAAQELWKAGGFAAVTTRAVAARAQVNEVTLFRHFGSKDGLVQAMVAQAIPTLHPSAGDDGTIRATAPDLEGDLEAWARTYLAETLPKADMLLLGLVEAREHPDLAPVLLSVPHALGERLARHLRERAGTDGFAMDLCADVARAFYAALFAEVLVTHLDRESPPSGVGMAGTADTHGDEARLEEARQRARIDAVARRTAKVFACTLRPTVQA